MSPSLNRQHVGVTLRHNDRGGVLSPMIYGISFEMEDTLRTLLRDVDGITGLRLLENCECPKLFVVTKDENVERDHTIVRRLLQVEDLLPTADLNYDIVPEESAHFIPEDARSIL
jgi:hypothetical protein